MNFITNFIGNFIGILWSIHVLIAALLYPRSLLPGDSAQDLQKRRIYKSLSMLFGTLILFINIALIVILFTRSNLIDLAKVLFILMTWLLVGIIYIAFNHLRDIYDLFSILEDEAIQSRDQSVMLIRAGQAALRAGNRKLFGDVVKEQFSLTFLLKKVGPLALLFLQKEKSVVNIGIEAAKLFFMGTRIFKNLF